MTGTTKNLILQFIESKGCDTQVLTGIFIGIQEEDNVSDMVCSWNGFRTLRNLAAHEPANLIQFFSDKANDNCSKMVIQMADGHLFVLEVVQLCLWLLECYLKTKDPMYYRFAETLFKWRFPYWKYCANYTLPEHAIDGVSGLVENFYMIQMKSVGRMPKTFNTKDPIMKDLYDKNQQVFWKIAVPDMYAMLCSLFNHGGIRDFSVRFVIDLYYARDVKQK